VPGSFLDDESISKLDLAVTEASINIIMKDANHGRADQWIYRRCWPKMLKSFIRELIAGAKRGQPMSDWREGAAAIRAAFEKQQSDKTTATARRRESEGLLPQQSTFARRMLADVLRPVLQEFVLIVTGVSGNVVTHEDDKRTLSLTCELDSLRYSVSLYLLFDSTVRIAVSLMPSHGDGRYRDYGLYAREEEVERWFGTSLVKLYDNR